MSLSTFEVRCEESDFEKIQEQIINIIQEKGYSIKSLDSNTSVSTFRIRKGLNQWNVKIQLKLDRTGNFVIGSIMKAESKFKLPNFQGKKNKSTENKQQSHSIWGLFWRFRWYAYIITAIGAIILSFLPRVNDSLNYIGFVLFGIVGLLLLLYLGQYIIDSIKSPKTFVGADKIAHDLEKAIKQIANSEKDKVRYCWQCFKEVPENSETCPNCNAKVAKL